MEVTLIRHGESKGNILNVHQGWGDFGLTERGRRQARVTMERLAGIQYDRILVSDADRAVETAHLLFPRQTRLIEPCRSLRGLDCGVLRGLTEEQAREAFGELFTKRDQFDFSPFHGERPAAMVGRIHHLMGELEAGRHERTAVVTHGGPIRAILFYILELDFAAHFRHFDFRNCGISEIRYADDTWRILTINDCSHLDYAHVTAMPSIPVVDGI